MSALEETCREIADKGGTAIFVRTDISDEKQVIDLIAADDRPFSARSMSW